MGRKKRRKPPDIPKEDLVGQKFGKWTVIEYADHSHWNCRCACENGTIRKICQSTLRKGKSKSCGCMRATLVSESKALKDNLLGKVFGKLTVIERSHSDKNGVYWVCSCNCNPSKMVIVRGISLKRGEKTHCGCSRISEKLIDLTGKFFGSWEVLKIDRSQKRKMTYWTCKCSCGHIKSVSGANLVNGISKSCGHWKRNDSLTLEDRRNSKNRSLTPEHQRWRNRIYKRDNWKCIISGLKSNYKRAICVHHIYNWSDNPDLRFDISNGVTLSDHLHKLFHKVFGNRYNTPEQFEEFVSLYSNITSNHPEDDPIFLNTLTIIIH